ncbi:MAG TPA: peroxide stress protein YaaA [Solirubrobacterales bacterium]|nr:peroxide stress protein YaaA [Solirubrobacterales bacterium]
MKILLPPSEGKAEPEGGEPVDLDSLAFAEELRKQRQKLLRAVDPKLRKAPAAPAAEVYTGVLYQRLDLAGLSAAARRRAAKRVLIATALWGFVRPTDRIPCYRLPPSTKLDGIGPLAAWWRPALRVAMPDEPGETIVDMRSGAYTSAWKPNQATLLAVRAFREEKGERKAVSHMAKAVRGDVARALLRARSEPKDPKAVAAIATDAGFEVELTPASLDVIVND